MPAHMAFRPPHRFSGCVRGQGQCSWRPARACREGHCIVGGGRGRLALLHYFQKTVESFLLKRDISLPHQRQLSSRPQRAEPSGIRSLCSMYDNGRFGQVRNCRSLRTFPFEASYGAGVARLLEATAGWGDAGRSRGAPAHRDDAASPVHGMFRRAIASGRAFSPEIYARMTPAFGRARHCDALQHYLDSCCESSATARVETVGRSAEPSKAPEWGPLVELSLIPQSRCLAQPNWTAWSSCVLRLG